MYCTAAWRIELMFWIMHYLTFEVFWKRSCVKICLTSGTCDRARGRNILLSSLLYVRYTVRRVHVLLGTRKNPHFKQGSFIWTEGQYDKHLGGEKMTHTPHIHQYHDNGTNSASATEDRRNSCMSKTPPAKTKFISSVYFFITKDQYPHHERTSTESQNV